VAIAEKTGVFSESACPGENGGLGMASGSARYANDAGAWVLRLAGDVRHPLAPALNALLDRAFEDTALTRFVIDLSAAEGIDSTCLGILARIANHLSGRGLGRPAIISPNADVTTLLRVVCFDRLFHLVADPPIDPQRLEPVAAQAADERDMLALILEAHRRLCAIDARTHTVFQDVVTALETEQRGS
jgi:anti-anti-sigma factor